MAHRVLAWSAPALVHALGMNLVIVDVQADALKQAHDELKSLGATVMAKKVDVSNADAMQELGQRRV